MALSLISLGLTGLHRLLSAPLRLALYGLGRMRLGRRGVVRLPLAPGRDGDSQHHRVRLLNTLQELGDDPAVAEVVLDLDGLTVGWSGIQDLQQGIRRLKGTGTRVTAHVDGAGLRELSLLATLDRATLTPSAELMLTGLGARLAFYADALDLIGVEVQVESAGRFKSFGESYIRTYASQENREQLRELLTDLQDQLLGAIALARPQSAAPLTTLLGQAPQDADSVLDAGLVDALAYPDELKANRRAVHGSELSVMSYSAYSWSRGWSRRLGRKQLGGPVVAVVHLEGAVTYGEQSRRSASISSDTVVPLLNGLAEQSQVSAVVLSVQSPGGSALASDLIARAVRRLGEKKPVVAVFGDVSASGGYYLAAPAAEIIARPGTITGSIGVVGGKPVFAAALARLGVRDETVAVGPDAGMFGPFAAFTPDQRRRYQASIARAYDRFLGVVSAGRRMPREAVHAVAQGRVWTGKQALGHGLIDHIGDVHTGLGRARVLSGLGPSEGRVVHFRTAPPRWRGLMDLASGRGQVEALSALAGLHLVPGAAVLAPLLPLLRRQPHHPLALMPLPDLLD